MRQLQSANVGNLELPSRCFISHVSIPHLPHNGYGVKLSSKQDFPSYVVCKSYMQ